MASKLGYLPEPVRTTATNVQVLTNNKVNYTYPVGFHVPTTIGMLNAPVLLTPQQTLNGLLLVDPGGSVTLTLPTAVLLLAAMNGAQVGSSFRFIIRNTDGDATTLTLGVGAGITAYVPLTAATTTLTTAQNKTSEYMIVFDNVTVGAVAATLYTISSAHTH